MHSWFRHQTVQCMVGKKEEEIPAEGVRKALNQLFERSKYNFSKDDHFQFVNTSCNIF